jgi:carboxymethylenebutenolidase
MELDVSENITVEVADGAFTPYVARPKAKIAPAIVVLQEIFGVNVDIRKTCDELAEAGFIAVAPDLFWRTDPELDLNALNEAEWARGLAIYQAYDPNVGVEDIAATVQAARHIAGGSGKVGVMGFCLGGLLTYLTAARHDVDAAVEYYGGGTENHVEEDGRVKSPLLVHLGEEDEFISKHAQAIIKQAFAATPHIEVHSYPGCSHAFARHSGLHYDPGAAALANGRTVKFFSDHLN